MIFSPEQTQQLEFLYSQYNETIKPLLIAVESRYEALPVPIHNELRSFNDHIARCYMQEMSSTDIDNEIKKAGGHIKRTIFDCFKFLNVKLFDFYKEFSKNTSKIDLTSINNGEFFIKYRKLATDAQLAVREAKKLESKTGSHDQAFAKYEEAYQTYTELETLIIENTCNVSWAKSKYRLFTVGTVVWSIVIFIFGAIATLVLEDLVKAGCDNHTTLQCLIEYYNSKFSVK